MKRPCWNESMPCPISKGLESKMSQQMVYFLSSPPDQCSYRPLPTKNVCRVRITLPQPRLASSPESDEEEALRARRRELSPSPEVDLSIPCFKTHEDDLATPINTLDSNSTSSFFEAGGHGLAIAPLEKDESEFTQTADCLLALQAGAPPVDTYQWSREDLIFSEEGASISDHAQVLPFLSPSIRIASMQSPKKDHVNFPHMEKVVGWDSILESIEIEELDTLFSSS